MTQLEQLQRKYDALLAENRQLKQQLLQLPQDDPIYLMSVEEYDAYQAEIPAIHCWWWLRTPNSTHNIAEVMSDGTINACGESIDYEEEAVRPILNLNIVSQDTTLAHPISLTELKPHLVFCGMTWLLIDEDKRLYITELPIGYRAFDKHSNDYQKSEIRQYLLDWYNTRKDW